MSDPQQLYEITRADGRSNQQVIIDLVKDAAPGTTFTYDTMATVLGVGTKRVYARHDVQSVVRLANERLLREHSRCLKTLRGVGYAVAHGSEHCRIAGDYRRKSRQAVRRALLRLEHVRTDEMSPQQRESHVAQANLSSALFFYMRAIEKGQERHDRLLGSMTAQVDQINAKVDELDAKAKASEPKAPDAPEATGDQK